MRERKGNPEDKVRLYHNYGRKIAKVVFWLRLRLMLAQKTKQ